MSPPQPMTPESPASDDAPDEVLEEHPSSGSARIAARPAATPERAARARRIIGSVTLPYGPTRDEHRRLRGVRGRRDVQVTLPHERYTEGLPRPMELPCRSLACPCPPLSTRRSAPGSSARSLRRRRRRSGDGP